MIDFSLYLRNNKASAEPGGGVASVGGSLSDEVNSSAAAGPDISAVLDQKNYIEELNRHLK